ncbi:hypothetical protein BUALT_Bualt05G0047000 [Buddleja alternifolia]|uniref:Retroviral polymerase SH3-like domain-containing protein n=1 Tax=Buddleja alternifolia TaxID=168488 RepID=A0AAV6XII7_9LAMI|nr:hypothetical protein BUALT_Bualt05G0047000 [Buddleja alternifolia]
MVRGLPCLDISSKICEDCLAAKQHRNPFPRQSTWRTSHVLEVVHADICGPISPMSNNNKRSPTLAVKNKTPEEAWSGFKPSVTYFRVFGCVSHVHVPDCKRTKLDDKTLRCIFLGVSEELKAYRLYDPISQKIIISRDVVFEEDNSWDWDKNHQEAILIDLNWGKNDEEPNAAAENRDEAQFDEHGNTESATNTSNKENL